MINNEKKLRIKNILHGFLENVNMLCVELTRLTQEESDALEADPEFMELLNTIDEVIDNAPKVPGRD